MGITYSTNNYDLIIDLLDPLNPIYDGMDIIEQSIFEDTIIPKAHTRKRRFLVYKHKFKEIYVLYEGDICPILKCWEVNENLLLNASKQFASLNKLKEYIEILPYNINLLNDINNIIDSEYEYKMNELELGILKPVKINYNEFTDDESDISESDNESDMDNEINVVNNIEKKNISYDYNLSDKFIKKLKFDLKSHIIKTNSECIKSVAKIPLPEVKDEFKEKETDTNTIITNNIAKELIKTNINTIINGITNEIIEEDTFVVIEKEEAHIQEDEFIIIDNKKYIDTETNKPLINTQQNSINKGKKRQNSFKNTIKKVNYNIKFNYVKDIK